MPAKLIEVADAVVTLISSTVTSNSGTVARSYVPRPRLEDTASLLVYVVPRTEQRSRVGRGVFQRLYTVDVGVVQRATNDTDRDARMLFVETLANYLESNELPTNTGVRLKAEDGVTLSPNFDWKALDETQQIVGVIRCIYWRRV